MNKEFTGRHYEITPTIRKSVETGLTKIRKILGTSSIQGDPGYRKAPHEAEIYILRGTGRW